MHILLDGAINCPSANAIPKTRLTIFRTCNIFTKTDLQKYVIIFYLRCRGMPRSRRNARNSATMSQQHLLRLNPIGRLVYRPLYDLAVETASYYNLSIAQSRNMGNSITWRLTTPKNKRNNQTRFFGSRHLIEVEIYSTLF